MGFTTPKLSGEIIDRVGFSFDTREAAHDLSGKFRKPMGEIGTAKEFLWVLVVNGSAIFPYMIEVNGKFGSIKGAVVH